MCHSWRKITPKFYFIVVFATFVPILYITVIDLWFRHKIDDDFSVKIASGKSHTVQQQNSRTKANNNLKNKMRSVDKSKLDKGKNQSLKKDQKKLEVKLQGVNHKNASRYLYKTHTNSSAVLGDAEKQARLCPLLPKRLGKNKYMRCDMTKPTKWLCAQRRLRSAWASAQSNQSLCCPHEESLGP